MSAADDFKLFLPKYLSAESQEELFAELKSFPENIDKRFFTELLKASKVLYQGDGIRDLPIVEFATRTFLDVKALIISNTCDTDPTNKRRFSAYAAYAPILNLSKWEATLKSNRPKGEWQSIEGHIQGIRAQTVTQFFYLPPSPALPNESFVRLDRLFSIPTDEIPADSIPERRIFTLSNYGFYVLLFKLSLHFTRIQDSIDRNADPT